MRARADQGQARARSRPAARRRRRSPAAAARPSAERPSARACGTNRMNAGKVARAEACAAISAIATCSGSAMRERAPSQHEGDDERAGAEGADAAVAHDRELLLAVLAAAETVGGIGEPVLVQAAGGDQRRRERERGAAAAAARTEMRSSRPARRSRPRARRRSARPSSRARGRRRRSARDRQRQAGGERMPSLRSVARPLSQAPGVVIRIPMSAV